MNKIQRATNKFFNTMGTMAPLYGRSRHSILYHACYFTRAFNTLLPKNGYDAIDTCPLCNENNDIIGIVVLGSYYEEVEDEESGEYTPCYFSNVLHQIRFTQEQLRYIRAHGYDKVA